MEPESSEFGDYRHIKKPPDKPSSKADSNENVSTGGASDCNESAAKRLSMQVPQHNLQNFPPLPLPFCHSFEDAANSTHAPRHHRQSFLQYNTIPESQDLFSDAAMDLEIAASPGTTEAAN